MYIYVYIYMCVYIYVYIYICVCVYSYPRLDMCTQTNYVQTDLSLASNPNYSLREANSRNQPVLDSTIATCRYQYIHLLCNRAVCMTEYSIDHLQHFDPKVTCSHETKRTGFICNLLL